MDLRPPSEAEKSSRDGPCQPPNTRQQGGYQEAAGSAREKPANAFGRGLKLLMNPAEALEHNSIARVCREKQDLARGENSAAHQRAQKRWLRHTMAGQIATAACELRKLSPARYKFCCDYPLDAGKKLRIALRGKCQQNTWPWIKLASNKLVRRETLLRPVASGRFSHAGRKR